jgi:hypothetical protein
MPLYPIIRRARNARGPQNLIDRSKLNRDGRWVGGKPVGGSASQGAYRYLHPREKAAPAGHSGGSVVDPPKLEEWKRASGIGSGEAQPEKSEVGRSIPEFPPEEELMIKNPFSKKNWNFTLKSQITKYKPELAKKLKLLVSA